MTRRRMMTKLIVCVLAVGIVDVLGTNARADLLTHYTFDADYSDSSGNGNDASLKGIGTDDAPSGNSGITTTSGEYVFGGGAMDFSADRDYVDIPDFVFANGNTWSVAFWGKLRNADTKEGMVLGDRSGVNDFVHLNDEGGWVRWRSSTSVTLDFQADPDADWHHYVLLAGDADNDTAVDDITLYRDGVVVQSHYNINTSFAMRVIGDAYTSNDYDFNGQIDEVWIFDHALSEAEADSLYSNNAVPEPSTWLLAVLGLLSIGGWRMRCR